MVMTMMMMMMVVVVVMMVMMVMMMMMINTKEQSKGPFPTLTLPSCLLCCIATNHNC